MVRTARIACRDGCDTEVLQWAHPLVENRGHGHVPLQVDPSDFAAAVINVEVAGNLLLFWLKDHRSCRFAQKPWHFELVGRGGKGNISKMFFHIPNGPQQSLLFASP